MYVFFYLYWETLLPCKCGCVSKRESVTCDDLNRDMMMFHLCSGDIMPNNIFACTHFSLEESRFKHLACLPANS